MSIDPNNTKALFRKATALKGMGRLDEALELIESGLLIDPNNTAALQDRTVIMQSKEKLSATTQLITEGQYRQADIRLDELIRTLGP